MGKVSEGKLPAKEKVAFGLGDMAYNILFAAVSFYLLYFMINVGGLNAKWAAAVFLASKAWDAVTDYLMGRIVDKTHSRFGKRKVYMLFGAIPFALTFVFLWIVPSTDSQALKFLFYTAMYMLFCTAWTVIYIPYNTLAPNMTKDYDERTNLNSIRIILANIGLILGAAVFSLLGEGRESLFYGVFRDAGYADLDCLKYAYLVSSVVFAALALVIWLLCTFNVKERFEYAEENTKGFFQTLKEFFSLKEFRTIMATFLLSMMGFDIIMTVFIFYINDALAFNTSAYADLSMVFIAIPLVFAIASAPLWDFLCKKFQKHIVYGFACLYMSACLMLSLIIPQQNILWTIVHVILCGIGMSAIQIIPYAALPDVVDVDEYVNGQRREGAYYGVTQFCYKIASGVGCALVSFILGVAGYIEADSEAYYQRIADLGLSVGDVVTQTDEALMAIRIVLAVIPSVIFILSIVTSHRAGLSRERFNKIRDELNERHKAEPTE